MTEPEKQTPIDRIIKRLSGTYCAQWDRMIGQAPIADVKTVWAHELSGFLQSRDAMQAIAWALDNLPETCPNVIQFKALCRKAPAIEAAQLPPPKPSPEVVAKVMAALAPRDDLPRVDHKAWAQRILDDVAAGAKRTPTVIRMAKDALGVE